ncbi:hypothetical protein IB256_06230 [Pseudomonas sp. PDM17]|uniref:hypothetical protein n=1 Tax=Pseudomonas sp. PDM17 TaxID=2769285 RepID=UPI0017834C61|nr:hypothetical protein [Pseudomonas sp. PDM17]MBD9500365.1 hypothetical protein [Pseudomonas sp. PDM17]
MHWEIRSQKWARILADPGEAESNKNDKFVNIGFLVRNSSSLTGALDRHVDGGAQRRRVLPWAAEIVS